MALAAATAALLPAAAAQPEKQLRVCSDPNNMPFSNRAGEGFENKLAELVARDLGESVVYTWWAEQRGFIRNTLKAGRCDVVIGIPTAMKMVTTTAPYYRSTYAFISRAERRLDLHSMKDPRLSQLKIGVHLIGNNGFNTPPAMALGEEGIVDNVVGFMIYGDYRQPDPPARLLDAVASGTIDVAAAWGPLAGWYALRAPVKLAVTPITDTASFAPLSFEFDISLGVRKGDEALKSQLDSVLAREREPIRALLKSYGVPLLDGTEPTQHTN